MEFFIRYAEALEQELNESGSDINDIFVDFELLVRKETTVEANDTSEAVTEQPKSTRPTVDGVMPCGSKPPYQPRSTESDTVKLRDVCPPESSKLEYSRPQELKNSTRKGPVRIVRKKTNFTRKGLGKR